MDVRFIRYANIKKASQQQNQTTTTNIIYIKKFTSKIALDKT